MKESGVRNSKKPNSGTSVRENGLSSLPIHTYHKFAGEVSVWLGQSWHLAASEQGLEIIVKGTLKTLEAYKNQS